MLKILFLLIKLKIIKWKSNKKSEVIKCKAFYNKGWMSYIKKNDYL